MCFCLLFFISFVIKFCLRIFILSGILNYIIVVDMVVFCLDFFFGVDVYVMD